MTREEVLDEAKRCICTDRNNQYGEPENSFPAIANLWNVYLKTKYKELAPQLSTEDAGIMLALFKIGRMITGQPKDDNFVDAIGYLACTAEIKEKKDETVH